MGKEINLPKTILKSGWSYFVILFLFISATLYASKVIQTADSIGEVCFYGLIILMLARECSRWLNDFTFYSYKLEKESRQ